MKGFILVDYEKCHGCSSCTLACSFAKTGEFNPSRADISVAYFPEAGNLTIPMLCQNCLEPACMEVCPVQAIHRDEKKDVVVIDDNLCIGCKMCMMSCPIGGVGVDHKTSKMVKCNLCDGDPECVKNCNFDALQLVMPEEATTKKRKEGAKKLAKMLNKLT
jgi:Fe-S-cluster-containing hydrogenase component 2